MKLEHILLLAGAAYLFTQKKSIAAPAIPSIAPGEISPPPGAQIATSQALATQSQAISDLTNALTAIQTAAPTSDSNLPGAQLVPQEAAPVTTTPAPPAADAPAVMTVALPQVKPAEITFGMPGKGSSVSPAPQPLPGSGGASRLLPFPIRDDGKGRAQIPERGMWRRGGFRIT